MATVTQTWAHVPVQTYTETEERLRAHLQQAQLDFWEKMAETYRRELENIALRVMKGEKVLVHYDGKSVEVVSMTTVLPMSGEIP